MSPSPRQKINKTTGAPRGPIVALPAPAPGTRRRRVTKAELANAVAVAVVTDVLRKHDLFDALLDPDSTTVGYLRMSVDRDLDGANIERDALVMGRWAVERNVRFRPDPETGLPFFVDNSKSAKKTKKGRETNDLRRGRPAHNRMIELVHSGTADRIVTPHSDRLYRRMDELGALLRFLKNLGRPLDIVTLESGGIDLSTAAGRHIAKGLVNMAEYESERITERVMKDFAESRADGCFVGSVAPYGYSLAENADGGLAIVADEADVLLEAATGIVEGTTTYREIARRWDETVPRIRAEYPWDVTQVRQRLVRPTLAGLISYQPPANDDGDRAPRTIIGEGRWEPIYSRPLWDALLVVDGQNQEIYGGPRRRGPFTGLFRCGECSGPLFRHARKRDGSHRWVCLSAKVLDVDADGAPVYQCGKVAVAGADAERWVLDNYRTASVAVAASDASDDDGGRGIEEAAAEVAAVKGQLAMYREMLDDPDDPTDRGDYADLVRLAKPRLAKAELRLRTRQATRLGFGVRHVDADGLLAFQWDGSTVDEKRLALSYAFPYGIAVDRAPGPVETRLRARTTPYGKETAA